MAATARFVDAMLHWMHDFPTGSHIATRDRRTSPKNEARILTLLQNGDTERLSALFQHGTDANLIIRAQLKPPHNSSLKLALPLLHIAASNNYLYVAECLLSHGADINGRDKYGTTAVHWAAAAGHLKMLHLLRRRNADLDCADKLGMTPLHIAAHAGRTRALTMLLRNGADCAAQSKHGELALDLARTQKNANCKRALIAALSAKAKQIELIDAEKVTVRKVEHDRSGTMLVHCVHSEAECDSENEESALSELSAHVDSLRAETARMREREEERERERLFVEEQERQLERSLAMSQRQKERELKRQRSRSKSRSQSRSRRMKKEKEEKGAEEKAQRVKNEKKRRRKVAKEQSGKGQTQRVSYAEMFQEKAFVRWLECEVALPMYRELFATKGYDRLEAVKALDRNGLRKMGVKKFRDREVFVREIRKLQMEEVQRETSLKRMSFSRQMSL